jgi:hypothetical protein
MMTLATTPAGLAGRPRIAMDTPGPGETRDGVRDIFSTVQGRVIGMMGGGAAEMAILGDSPSLFIESDVYNANAIAGIICRSDASRAAFLEHAYQEALAIIEENKPVVLALAQALIDHPERTLNAAETVAGPPDEEFQGRANSCRSGSRPFGASALPNVFELRWPSVFTSVSAFTKVFDTRKAPQ